MADNINFSPLLETIIFKLTFRQKKYIYEIARLEYKIWLALSKLAIVDNLIEEERNTINSIKAAIKAAGEGRIAEKLSSWLVKAEYKLFKLQLRKNKIDIARLLVNQSKLGQIRAALIIVEQQIEKITRPEEKKSDEVIVNIENNIPPFQKDGFSFENRVNFNNEILAIEENILKLAS